MKKTLFTFLPLGILVFSGALNAEEEALTISELPLFRALSGKRTESGILLLNAQGQTFQGSAKSVGEPFLDGLWFQIEGKAEYGPITWSYRWMFLLRQEGGGNAVYGTYLDSTGQKVDYKGSYDAEAQRVQLIAKMADGTGRFQMTLQEEGTVRIESVNSNTEDNPVVTYSAGNIAGE